MPSAFNQDLAWNVAPDPDTEELAADEALDAADETLLATLLNRFPVVDNADPLAELEDPAEVDVTVDVIVEAGEAEVDVALAALVVDAAFEEAQAQTPLTEA